MTATMLRPGTLAWTLSEHHQLDPEAAEVAAEVLKELFEYWTHNLRLSVSHYDAALREDGQGDADPEAGLAVYVDAARFLHFMGRAVGVGCREDWLLL